MNKDLIQARLTIDEGLRHKIYVDSEGNATVGIGHKLMEWDMDHIQQVFEDDLKIAIAECEKYPWFEGLDDARQMVTVCLMFNLGAPRFSGFVAMISCLKAGNYQGAADEMLNSIWAHEVGNRAKVYAEIMRTGVWEPTTG